MVFNADQYQLARENLKNIFLMNLAMSSYQEDSGPIPFDAKHRRAVLRRISLRVYRELGPCHLEFAYQNGLAIELQGICRFGPVQLEVPMAQCTASLLLLWLLCCHDGALAESWPHGGVRR